MKTMLTRDLCQIQKQMWLFVLSLHIVNQLHGALFIVIDVWRSRRRFAFSRDQSHSQREQGRVGMLALSQVEVKRFLIYIQHDLPTFLEMRG